MATLSVFAARVSGEEADMRFAVDISPVGRWGAPVLLAELAALAEESGWDGVFCEDYLAFADRLDTYDVWISLGLMASATERVTLASIITPLAWRQPGRSRLRRPQLIRSPADASCLALVSATTPLLRGAASVRP